MLHLFLALLSVRDSDVMIIIIAQSFPANLLTFDTTITCHNL